MYNHINLFLIGLIFGSFINVIRSRVPIHKSIIIPASQCDYCNKPIYWHDNIPVISWILLNGKCRFCNQKIPLSYPIVELLTGGFFVLNYKIFKYIKNDTTMFERQPMSKLANERKLMAFKHNGFWKCMDTLRDKIILDKMWNEKKALWKK